MKNAIIYFLKPEEGGRKMLPTSTIYYATTIIEGLPQKNWSIVIQFEKPLEIQEYTAPCKIKFLVDDAPFYVFNEVREIPVYEGPKIVGRIIF